MSPIRKPNVCGGGLALLAVLLMVNFPRRVEAADDALAVVVNKTTFTMMLSLSDLRQMYLGERGRWPDGKKVMAILPNPSRPEYKVFVKVVTGMSEAEYKRTLMQANFAGKEVAAPRTLDSAAAIKQFVAATPGAVGCIRADEVDATVRAVKVDGVAPGEPGYKLR